MVLEIRRCIKSVIFFRVSRSGRRGGGYIAVLYGKSMMTAYVWAISPYVAHECALVYTCVQVHTGGWGEEVLTAGGWSGVCWPDGGVGAGCSCREKDHT